MRKQQRSVAAHRAPRHRPTHSILSANKSLLIKIPPLFPRGLVGPWSGARAGSPSLPRRWANTRPRMLLSGRLRSRAEPSRAEPSRASVYSSVLGSEAATFRWGRNSSHEYQKKSGCFYPCWSHARRKLAIFLTYTYLLLIIHCNKDILKIGRFTGE